MAQVTMTCSLSLGERVVPARSTMLCRVALPDPPPREGATALMRHWVEVQL